MKTYSEHTHYEGTLTIFNFKNIENRRNIGATGALIYGPYGP